MISNKKIDNFYFMYDSNSYKICELAKGKKSKVNLGIFIEGPFLPSGEGATNRFHNMCSNLSRLGVNITVFHCYRGWSDIKQISEKNFKTYLLPPKLFYDPYFISKLVQKEKLDIIQMNDPEVILRLGIKIKELTKVKLCFEAHIVVNEFLKTLGVRNMHNINYNKFLEVISAENADLIIALSDGIKKSFGDFGIDKDKIHVIYMGVDTEKIRYFGSNIHSKTILFLGNNFYEPNKRAIINIVKKINPALKKLVPDVKILIAGDYPKNLSKFNKGNVHFTGYIDDLNKVLSQATIAINPLDSGSGFKTKIINYFAAGLPVVATRIGLEGVKYKSNVIVCDDTSKFPKIIANLLNNKLKLANMGKIGRTIVLKNYKYSSMAKLAKKVYEKYAYSEIKSVKKLAYPDWLKENFEKGRFRSVRQNNKTYKTVGFGQIKTING